MNACRKHPEMLEALYDETLPILRGMLSGDAGRDINESDEERKAAFEGIMGKLFD